MASFRLSNNLIGILNFVTLVLSIPILAVGIWLGHRADGTECERYLSAPVIALGAFLLAVSLAGLVGACCRVTWLLWVYLLAMFVLIVVLFGITVFAFVVTNKGAGEAVSGRGFREYRLGDYSNWLQNRVQNTKNWNRIRSCLQDSKVCTKLQDKNQTRTQFMASDLSPIESGCCKPPTSCGFAYSSATNWTETATANSTDPDCTTWNNAPSTLCYSCQSCKAGVVATIKKDWKRVAVVNIIFLVFIIIVYSVGCCAFRNNRRDNAYRGGWKGNGGYA